MKHKMIGVLLMTYGSPSSLDDIPEYLTHIYRGKVPDESLIQEFKRRYSLIGGSPLIQITNDQAKALAKYLNAKSESNVGYIVKTGMRFSAPFIKNVAQEFEKEVDSIIGIIMSPQYSPIIMKGYVDVFNEALGKFKGEHIVAGSWHDNPSFILAIAMRVEEALSELSEMERRDTQVLFSAHSMPKRVVATEPGYIDNLKETACLVAKQLDFPRDQWMFCYQSAGHTPEEWLKPDFADIMPELKKQGKKRVLIAPIQFLADHLEILYDIEIAAREQAEEHGIEFRRIQSLNISPLFIQALAEVVEKTLNI